MKICNFSANFAPLREINLFNCGEFPIKSRSIFPQRRKVREDFILLIHINWVNSRFLQFNQRFSL